jgi:hypothetical protein
MKVMISFGKITQFSIPESLLAILAVPKEMGTSSTPVSSCPVLVSKQQQP